jgi:hypothetical protein
MEHVPALGGGGFLMEDGRSAIDEPEVAAFTATVTRKRRHAIRSALKALKIPQAVAIDDCAAMLYRDGRVERVSSWREGATAHRLRLLDGHVAEDAYDAEDIAKEKANR